ncbi:hypothetical protein [Serratia sp. M24T3]|uniref:hypothetical protein n=1 Tax=Serratia sp. M24T3 TaxID=932213 RepID=UPI00025BBCF8|nr:hypothetical protein [Serratia sp. M24T3]EIC82047.1 hypothetical protein SPM24T3_23904 [Serratia sp. M24T3]
MKAENTQVNIELKSWRELDKQKEQPNVEPKQEPIFTIDLHDPNSPPESVLEKMSNEQQTWLSSLLRPFDMVYHICQGAYNKLNDAYQQQITETLRNFEKTLIEVQYELNSLLDEDCLSKLSQLYLRCGECKKEFERLSIKQSSAKDLADAVVAKKYDIGKNKKQDITPEYSLPQIKILYDFNQQTEELAKAKKNTLILGKKLKILSNH